jgi:hypothetical protein
LRTQIFTALTLLAAVLTAPAWASVDTSPKPGGVYKLKPGIFVAKDVDCGSPPNVALRQYDGKGISTAHTRGLQGKRTFEAGPHLHGWTRAASMRDRDRRRASCKGSR